MRRDLSFARMAASHATPPLDSPLTNGEWARLSAFLAGPDRAPEALNIHGLDGLFHELAVGPRLLPPSQWMPAVLGAEAPVYEDMDQVKETLGLVLRHYNTVHRRLAVDSFSPAYLMPLYASEDRVANRKSWCKGFRVGVLLDSDIWQEHLLQDEPLTFHFGLFSVLADDRPWPDLARLDVPVATQPGVTRLDGMLETAIFAIRSYWKEHPVPPGGATVMPGPMPAAGRNEPCPCGSGLKYKKCHGATARAGGAPEARPSPGARASKFPFEMFPSADWALRLANEEWDTAGSPLKLHTDLPFDLISKSRLYANARLLLDELAAQGGAPATAQGNLNRKFVAEVIDRVVADPEFGLDPRSYKHQINEEDVFDLHRARVCCQVGKLIRRHSKRWMVSARARPLLAPGAEAALFRQLFWTQFREIKLGRFGLYEEIPGMQGGLGVGLFALSQVADEWQNIEGLEEMVIPPAVLAEIDSFEDGYARRSHLRMYLLRPLESLGLLEFGFDSELSYKEVVRVRKTSLFDRFIEFSRG